MANFKRTLNTNGKFKMLAVANGSNFINCETGETVDVANIINECSGEELYDLSETGTDITPGNE